MVPGNFPDKMEHHEINNTILDILDFNEKWPKKDIILILRVAKARRGF